MGPQMVMYQVMELLCFVLRPQLVQTALLRWLLHSTRQKHSLQEPQSLSLQQCWHPIWKQIVYSDSKRRLGTSLIHLFNPVLAGCRNPGVVDLAQMAISWWPAATQTRC